MGLADDLRAPAPESYHLGQMCRVRLLLDELDSSDPEGATALRDVMAAKQMQSTLIARRLSDAGFTLSVSSIQRHRRQECRCRS